MSEKKKPTIEELEAMLADPKGPLIEILPNGELDTVSMDDVMALRQDVAELKAEVERLREDAIKNCPRCNALDKFGKKAGAGDLKAHD